MQTIKTLFRDGSLVQIDIELVGNRLRIRNRHVAADHRITKDETTDLENVRVAENGSAIIADYKAWGMSFPVSIRWMGTIQIASANGNEGYELTLGQLTNLVRYLRERGVDVE